MTGRRFREALITHKNIKEQKKTCCSRTRSTKTRIETYLLFKKGGRKDDVRDLDPLKQGLKLACITRK
jgi:methyltransferase-like protein